MAKAKSKAPPSKTIVAGKAAEATSAAPPARAVKQPPVLFDATQKLIQTVSQELGFPVLSYWTSSRGGVCDNDTLAVYELLNHIGPGKKAGIFIKSDGGSVEATLRITNLIRENYPHVVALVPLNCASAATMIALGADEIRMGPMAHLTAIDSSLTHDLSPLDERDNRRVSVSQDELTRIVRLWNQNARDHHGNPYSELFKYVHPLVVGAIDRSSSLSIKICQEILSYHVKDDQVAKQISEHLNSAYPSHGYPITAREARRIGLNVSALAPSVNKTLLELNRLYSEMAQKALTDFNEFNYHDNEIVNIHETIGMQVYWQNDKDWNYVKDERRWQTMNDESSWRKMSIVKGKAQRETLHMR
jgi:hypothetical protein